MESNPELTVATDMEPTYMRTSGRRVACYSHGIGSDGTPVLFVHGGPGAGSSLGLIDALDLGRPMHFYDQTGCGMSDAPADASWYTLDNFVEELSAVVDWLDLDRFSLYGSSWGGMLATAYVLDRRPAGLESMVLASPLLSSPMWDADQAANVAELPPGIQSLVADAEDRGDYGQGYRRALDAYYREFLFRHGPEEFFAEAVSAGYSDAALALCGPSEFVMHGPLGTVDLFPRLHEIDVPVLVMCGDRDCLRVETAERYADAFPRADLAVLPDAGHMLRKDQPEVFAAVVERFLSLHRGRTEPK